MEQKKKDIIGLVISILDLLAAATQMAVIIRYVKKEQE